MKPTICQHRDCEGNLISAPTDPCLPPLVLPLECDTCGERYLIDAETDEMEVDA